MKIAIYSRDEQGLITYQGEQAWDSRQQVIEYYFLDAKGETEQVLGWPHNAITWHGNTGFGEAAKATGN